MDKPDFILYYSSPRISDVGINKRARLRVIVVTIHGTVHDEDSQISAYNYASRDLSFDCE